MEDQDVYVEAPWVNPKILEIVKSPLGVISDYG